MPQSILEMAKDLVMAQIAAGRLSLDNVQDAIQQTYTSLMTLKAQEETGAISPVETPPAPVDWRKSISRHAVTCLECGQSFRQLSIRHLRTHDLDTRSYRAKYGIPRTQALSARKLLARRREVVQQARPWEKAPAYVRAQEAKTAVKKGTRKKAARAKG